MKKLYHLDSPSEWYHADACVLSCFDTRFELVLRKFLTRRGFAWVDYIKVGGGARTLASPAHPEDRDFILRQFEASIKLHDTDRLVLMTHSDCGAYGGFDAFGRDRERERVFMREQLLAAAEVARAQFPNKPIDVFFFDFEGAWELA